jgi:hypothetical protein
MLVVLSECKKMICEGVIAVCQESGRLASSVVEVLKSGGKTTYRYLQNPLVAIISLLAVCVLSLELKERTKNLIDHLVPTREYRGRKQAGTLFLSTVVYFGTLFAYKRIFSLRLSNSTIMVVSLPFLVYDHMKRVSSRNTLIL